MSTRQIVQASLHQWNAIGPSGEVVGQMYKDGAQGVYTARVSGEVFRTWSRADALLWLSLKTCDKESREQFFKGEDHAGKPRCEAPQQVEAGEVHAGHSEEHARRDLAKV